MRFQRQGFDITFQYPVTLKEANDLAFGSTAGSADSARDGVGISQANVILVSRYDLHRPVTAGNVAGVKAEVDGVIKSLAGKPVPGTARTTAVCRAMRTRCRSARRPAGSAACSSCSTRRSSTSSIVSRLRRHASNWTAPATRRSKRFGVLHSCFEWVIHVRRGRCYVQGMVRRSTPLLAALVLATALAVGGCGGGGGGDKTFDNENIGITFKYSPRFHPITDIDFGQTAGANAAAQSGVALDKVNALIVSRYDLNVNIDKANLSKFKSEVDNVISRLAGHRVSGKEVEYGGFRGTST